jgi:antitoxin Phd
MSDKRLYVERRPEGDYAVRRPDSDRATAVATTQQKAIKRAKKIDPAAAVHVERQRRTARTRAATPGATELSAFRSRLRGRIVPASVSATEAKNEFGRVLEAALSSGAVIITRHDAPKAVLLAMDEFEELIGDNARRLDTLSGEFDSLLMRMQGPDVRARTEAAFGSTPDELGRAAVAAASKDRA